jgi:hypothetical protein
MSADGTRAGITASESRVVVLGDLSKDQSIEIAIPYSGVPHSELAKAGVFAWSR